MEGLSGPDPWSAPLEAADRALLEFAVRLTRQPGSIDAGAIQPLRQHGFSDRAIHDACQVVAYFGYVNRVANGLGVELEETE